MRRFMFTIVLVTICLIAHSQDITTDETKTEYADSLVYKFVPSMDTTLVGKSIFDLMPSKFYGGNANVVVYQSDYIFTALNAQIATNPSRKITGFRVRIFSDNKQSSRVDSEAALRTFLSTFPGIAAYRSYQAPFFRVTVGDFRTKSEAQELLQSVKGIFPAAFVVKENINFPIADRTHSFDVDTVKVVR